MIQTKISCVGSLFVKQMHFPQAGDVMEGHIHTYDHQTLLAYGSVEAEVEGNKTTFRAPQIIFIKAGKSHKFTALEDGTVAYCVHPLRDKETEDIIDPDGVPAGIDYSSVAQTLSPLTQG